MVREPKLLKITITKCPAPRINDGGVYFKFDRVDLTFIWPCWPGVYSRPGIHNWWRRFWTRGLCADQFETSTSSPRAFDCASCPGRGNLNPVYLLLWRNTSVSFFRFLQSLTDLQDRVSPLLVNNSFKRVLKRSLGGVITAYLSEKRAKCLIEDEICLWVDVLQYKLVGHLNGFFAPRRGNLNKPIFKSSYAREVARGGGRC